jgi:guanosine-3',5'-bis(diphosphate) 3'-pyrophosphohydrolase
MEMVMNFDGKLFIKVLSFASEKHQTQRRKNSDATPYINHPIALAKVLAVEGDVTDITVLCAAILHDTIEDTQTTEDELRQNFGDSIADVVLEVTDDKSLSKEQRKYLQIEHAANSSDAAKLVKLADKICNLRDILNDPPQGWDSERKRAYFEWAGRVVDQIRGVHPELERIFLALRERSEEL